MWLVRVVIRRYIDILIIIINFPYYTCMFNGGLVSVIFLQYIANVTLDFKKIGSSHREDVSTLHVSLENGSYVHVNERLLTCYNI